MLDKQTINRELGDLAQLFAVDVFKQLDSTNTYLLQNRPAQNQFGLCLSELQTAGRGRHGNHWHADAGDSLLFSVSGRFNRWPKHLSGLSVAVGMVVAQRLNQEFDLDIKIKWPNDLLIEDAKLGGILIELSGRVSTDCYVVMGVGLNILPRVTTFASDYPVCDLGDVLVDRNQLAARIARDLRELVIGFEQSGFQPLKSEFDALSALHLKQVRVIKDDCQLLSGTAVGISDSGQLLIEQANGKIEKIDDSRVSIRKL